MLRELAAGVATWHERRAVISVLSEKSDRDLADIGLSRALIHNVFDPEFASERGAMPGRPSNQEKQVLAELARANTPFVH